MEESEARKKKHVGNRDLKSSAFGWYLKPKDLIRSPRETRKARKIIESNTRPQSTPFIEASQRAEEEIGDEVPGRKSREYGVPGSKRRMHLKQGG